MLFDTNKIKNENINISTFIYLIHIHTFLCSVQTC